VCAEVSAALVAAHEMGLVHRDISPANVLLAPTGAKVIDFGISAPVGELEKKSMRLGTPAYISPERFANGGVVHPAADVYALGVLLYQTLTGALPWPADSISQLLSQQRYVAPAPLPPVPDLPAAVAELVARCLVRPPGQRPTSTQVTRKLAAVLGLRVAVSVPADPPHTRTDRTAPATHMLVVGQRPAAGVPAGPRPPAARPRPAPGPPVAGRPPLAMTMAAGPPRRRRSRKALLIGLASIALMGAGAVVDLVTVRAGAAGRAAAAAAAAQTGPASARPAKPDTTPALSGCSVAYHIRTTWKVGFTADVRVTNTGSVDVSTWTLTFALPGDQQILQGWNGVFGQSGQDVTVLDAGFNAKLLPGNSTTLGFNSSYEQRNPTPADFRLNGVRCSFHRG
jgi:serine/threonine-protein kinase